MKILIVDDDFISRELLQGVLKDYGSTHTAVNGKDAVADVRAAMASGEPFNLICMDIMMPEMDGQQALQQIRSLEEAAGIAPVKAAKIIMITTLGDWKNILASFKILCDGYVVKPIDADKLLDELRKFKFIK